MPHADQSPVDGRAPTTTVVTTTVFVRELRIEAEIGVHDHEYGRTQPLLVDVDLEVAPNSGRSLDDTVDYESIAAAARAIAAAGHVDLVECFARRLADLCLALPRVARARVRVEKPLALAPHAAGAGVEIVAVRG
jgi:dihydroneopterin aldolase